MKKNPLDIVYGSREWKMYQSMKEKQPFTIGGSVPLKEALLKETGAKPCDALSLNYQYLYIADYTNCIGGANKELPTHYQLPQDWHQAIQAVKDFFTEEKFEKGKWYYGELGDESYLVRYSHYEADKLMYVTEHVNRCKNEVAYYEGDTLYPKIIDCLQPATTEQIQFMLGKVAESRGYVEGVKVTCLLDDCDEVLDGRYFTYHEKSDSLYASIKDEEGDALIYEKGKWAELLPQEETTEAKEEYTVELLLNKIITHSNKLRANASGHGVVIAFAKHALGLLEHKEKPQEEPKPETLVLKDVVYVVKGRYHKRIKTDLHLTATHLQQLKAYLK
jgi:hypothetical protein